MRLRIHVAKPPEFINEFINENSKVDFIGFLKREAVKQSSELWLNPACNTMSNRVLIAESTNDPNMFKFHDFGRYSYFDDSKTLRVWISQQVPRTGTRSELIKNKYIRLV